jgi:hypothetical protein
MYNVHKFMDLNTAELGYFIEQVGLAALSFGVDPADLTPIAQALGTLFGQRCAQPVSVLGGSVPAELQAICTDDSCSQAANATCSSYAPATPPRHCNATGASPTGGANGTVPCPGSGTSTPGKASGSANASSVVSGTDALHFSIIAEVLIAGFIAVML